MKLIIKNKFMSAGGSSSVVDENGNDFLFVKGKVFSMSKKKWIKDLNKNKLYLVRNKIFHGIKRSCLIYDGEKNLVAKVIQSSVFEKGFEVEGISYKIDIKLNDRTGALDIIHDNKTLGYIEDVFSVANDTFNLVVNETKHAAFLVALVIAYDNIRDAIRKH